jgi:hypothetical protein
VAKIKKFILGIYKEAVNIIDFVDDFSGPKYQNYLMKHSLARIEIYKKEKFPYKIYKVKL